MHAKELSRLVAEMETRGENPFRKVLLKFGHQLTDFTVKVIRKLEIEMTREMTVLTRGRASNVHKPMRAGVKR